MILPEVGFAVFVCVFAVLKSCGFLRFSVFAMLRCYTLATSQTGLWSPNKQEIGYFELLMATASTNSL